MMVWFDGVKKEMSLKGTKQPDAMDPTRWQWAVQAMQKQMTTMTQSSPDEKWEMENRALLLFLLYFINF